MNQTRLIFKLIFFFSFLLILDEAHSQCAPSFTPDLPLLTATPQEINDLNTIISRIAVPYNTGSSLTQPELTALKNVADNLYATWNIQVNNGVITSNRPIGKKLNQSDHFQLILEYDSYLSKTNDVSSSEALDALEKMKNAIGYVVQAFCRGEILRDRRAYEYVDFAKIAYEYWDLLPKSLQDNLAYLTQVHSESFLNVWDDEGIVWQAGDYYNTDWIHNVSSSLLQLAIKQPTVDEKVRFLKAMKRYFERFLTPSYATRGGIKPDGMGFHHWAAHPRYLYAYRSLIANLYDLRETAFQISQSVYPAFSRAIAAHMMLANDARYRNMSLNGRRPKDANNELNKFSLREMAIAGGDILGLSTADPYFAGMYRRIYGNYGPLNYTITNLFEPGFFQFNYGNTGIYRKENWLITFKGQTSTLWGAEIYNNENHYGRYQAYGMFDVSYPGDKEAANGYNGDKWNWNYNNGATTIVYSDWNDLIAEKGRIDEYQDKDFAGALSFKKIEGNPLSNVNGIYGMFAMDFDEAPFGGLAFSTPVRSSVSTHNDSFVWQKSVYVFDDIIVALGSGITNDDTSNPTVTTLYQKLDNNTNPTVVNGTNYSGDYNTSFSGSNSNWLINNRNTGYYVASGDNIKVWSGSEVTPNYNQEVNEATGNPAWDNTRAYIIHGTSPNNKGFEFVMVPNTNISEMTTLSAKMQSPSTSLYKVHQKDSNAHIIEHVQDNIWGHAFFNAVSNLPYSESGSIIKGVDVPSMVMYQMETGDNVTLALTNPDVGLSGRRDEASQPIVKKIHLTLHGEWEITVGNPNVSIVSTSSVETILEFNTIHGLPYEIGIHRTQTLSTDSIDKNSIPIKLYPNPTSSKITLSTDELILIKSLSIFDFLGREVQYFEFDDINNKTLDIDVSTLKPGMYLLQIQLLNNISRLLKFIKH